MEKKHIHYHSGHLCCSCPQADVKTNIKTNLNSNVNLNIKSDVKIPAAEVKIRTDKSMHTGFDDGFEPLKSLDLSKCNDFDELLKGMSSTAFTGRTLGEAADVFYTMLTDPDCFVVLTLSGAMTAGKMGLIVCDMIDHGMVNAIVSTGALMTHGFVEAQGMTHFKYKFGQMNDRDLYEKGYDRIYDILELEKNLDDTELIFEEIMKSLENEEENNCNGICTLSSSIILKHCGKWLKENTSGRGILKSAYEKGVPVYVPAFTDSEMGLDFGIYNKKRIFEGKKPFGFNPFIDLEHFTEIIKKQKTLAIFTIGGGVPRNWAQQTACYIDLLRKRAGIKDGDNETPLRYKYGIRICPEPVYWGGLSGCTYSEGVTWGKFVPKEEGGQWSEVLCDATIAWPLIIKAAMERLEKNKVKINKNISYADDI